MNTINRERHQKSYPEIIEDVLEEMEISRIYTKRHYGEKLVPNGIRSTSDPRFKCTELPEHIRENISLKASFKLFALTKQPIPNGTRVTLTASSVYNRVAEVQNNSTVMKDQIADFRRLKFCGRSGRGTKFDLTITIDSAPKIHVKVLGAIKVTVDGPRKPRKPKQVLEQKADNTFGIKPSTAAVTLHRTENIQKDKGTVQPGRLVNTPVSVGDSVRAGVIKPLTWDFPLHRANGTSLSAEEKDDGILGFLEDRSSLLAQWRQLIKVLPYNSCESSETVIRRGINDWHYPDWSFDVPCNAVQLMLPSQNLNLKLSADAPARSQNVTSDFARTLNTLCYSLPVNSFASMSPPSPNTVAYNSLILSSLQEGSVMVG